MISNKRVSETQQPSTRKKRRTQTKKDLFKTYFQIGDLIQVETGDIYLIQSFTNTHIKLQLYARGNPIHFRYDSNVQWTVKWKVQYNVFLIKDRHNCIFTVNKYEKAYQLNQAVLYWHQRHTLYCVVIKVNESTITIQPIGINEQIEVDKRSYSVLPHTTILEDYAPMKQREHNDILYTSFCENDTIDGDWIVCDYDKAFDIYLLTKNNSVIDCQCKWVSAEDLLTKYVKGYQQKKYPVEYQYVGSLQLDRNTLETINRGHSWECLMRMHEYGDDYTILNDLHSIELWEWEHICGKRFGRIMDACCHLGVSKYAATYYRHLDLQTIRMCHNSQEDTIKFFQTLERQRMMASFNGTRDESNDMLKRYFCHMGTTMLRWFVHNKIYEKQRATLRSFSLKITNVTDKHLSLDIIYCNELDNTLLQPQRFKWLKTLETNLLFHFQKPLTPIFDVRTFVPHDYMTLDIYGKWYDQTNTMDSDLPLFGYQKMMVKQMMDQEERIDAVSHCLEYMIEDKNVNVLNGFSSKIDLDITHAVTGGFLQMDVGLGKTVCIIALCKQGPQKKTLILVPLTIMDQWKAEFKKFAPEITVTEFYGKKRDMDGDVVLSTYSTIMYQHKHDRERNLETHPIFLMFDRVVFDESHMLSNIKSAKVEACERIDAKRRWCVSATPITKNTFATLNGQLKMLRCRPFSNFMYQPSINFDSICTEKDKIMSAYHHILDGIFFIHTRHGLRHHNIPFKSFNVVKHNVFIDDPLYEHNFLRNVIRNKLLTDDSLIRYHKLNQLKNILLLSVTHPTLVPLTQYATKLETDQTIALTSEQVKSSMGNSNYEKEIKNTLDNIESAECVICMDVITRPTITPCKHIFCHDCITQQINHRPKCPMCRQPIHTNSLTEIALDVDTVEENDGMITFSDTLGRRYTIEKKFYDHYNKLTNLVSPKLNAVDKIINDNDGSVIIFSQFNGVLHRLKEKYPHAEMITGTSTRKKRAKAIANFQNKESNIFLLSTKCASIGITLTSGSHIIFMDPIMDKTFYVQAIGRLARTGQVNDVHAHVILVKKSIDIRMRLLSSTYADKISEMKKEVTGNQLNRVEKTFITDKLYELLT